MPNTIQKISEIKRCLGDELTAYFKRIHGCEVTGLYEMVICEVEKSLFQSVLEYANGNQTIAAKILGINRGTLRKKLKLYDLLAETDK